MRQGCRTCPLLARWSGAVVLHVAAGAGRYLWAMPRGCGYPVQDAGSGGFCVAAVLLGPGRACRSERVDADPGRHAAAGSRIRRTFGAASRAAVESPWSTPFSRGDLAHVPDSPRFRRDAAWRAGKARSGHRADTIQTRAGIEGARAPRRRRSVGRQVEACSDVGVLEYLQPARRPRPCCRATSVSPCNTSARANRRAMRYGQEIFGPPTDLQCRLAAQARSQGGESS